MFIADTKRGPHEHQQLISQHSISSHLYQLNSTWQHMILTLVCTIWPWRSNTPSVHFSHNSPATSHSKTSRKGHCMALARIPPQFRQWPIAISNEPYWHSHWLMMISVSISDHTVVVSRYRRAVVVWGWWNVDCHMVVGWFAECSQYGKSAKMAQYFVSCRCFAR